MGGQFLIGLVLAQATETFLEKMTDEKKGSPLIPKIRRLQGCIRCLLSKARGLWGKAYSTLGIGLLLWKQALSPLILVSYQWIHTDQIKILLLPSPIPPHPSGQLSV